MIITTTLEARELQNAGCEIARLYPSIYARWQRYTGERRYTPDYAREANAPPWGLRFAVGLSAGKLEGLTLKKRGGAWVLEAIADDPPTGPEDTRRGLRTFDGAGRDVIAQIIEAFPEFWEAFRAYVKDGPFTGYIGPSARQFENELYKGYRGATLYPLFTDSYEDCKTWLFAYDRHEMKTIEKSWRALVQ